MIRILLVDDHAMLRKGMVLLLGKEEDIIVVGEAGDGEEAIEQVCKLEPDIVLMEISMLRLNGIDATRQIVSRFPDIKVIAFSTHSAKLYIDEMLGAGARGYLLKESDPKELLQGIREVMRGNMYLSHAITGRVLESYVDQMSDNPLESQLKEDVGILRTKLHPPPIMLDLVPRQHLNEYLNTGRVKPLILISAPAGYGKSMLASSWLKECDWPTAWISLDQGDTDLRQFLLYFIAAIEDVFPNNFEYTQSLVKAPQLPSISILVTSLSNELGKIEQPFILVLDDYHRINTQSSVNELVDHLLEWPPLALHLVIVTRRDPPLQLVNLRAKGQMIELRMHDLCFTPSETQILLKNTAGFAANDEMLNNLDREVEGWVVGLRLVSQVLRTNENQEAFLKNLNGGVHQTNAYLLQEVFTRQPLSIQQCMIQSSILNRFCTPLCEAIYQKNHSDEMTEFHAELFINELTEGNLFVISLDSHGKWFRYHHLFQKLLQNELSNRMSSDEIGKLHLCASQWFETQGLIDEAIEHCLAADDMTGAAEIVEKQLWSIEQDKYSWLDIDRWLTALPVGAKEQQPRLLISQAWIANIRSQVNKIVPIVQKLELIDRENHLDQTCLGGLKHFQGVLHYWAGRGEIALKLFLEAKEIIPDKYQRIFGTNEIYIAMASNMSNQVKFALSLCNETIKLHDPHKMILSSRLFLSRSFLQLFLGNLSAVIQDAKKINNLLMQHDTVLVQGWAAYMEGSACFRQNNLSMAREHFSFSIKNKYAINTRVAIDSMIGLALSCWSIQQDAAVTDTIEILLKFAQDIGQPELIHVAQSGQARLALAQGNLNLAMEWSSSYDEPFIAPSMFFWLENPAITQARIMLTIGSPESLQRASKLLKLLQQEMDALHNTSQMIDIMLLQSVALDIAGNSEEALNVLDQVVVLAEPGRWIYPFVEIGQPMVIILKRLVEQSDPSDYLNLLLDKCSLTLAQAANSNSHQSQPGLSNQREVLTNRELDILELLTQRMQNKEMAAKLHVSSETIKTHLKHLYQKLGVSNRREAAAIAKNFIIPIR